MAKRRKIQNIAEARLSNHIEEYFAESNQSKEVLTSKELFKADIDVDIKTDLSIKEIILINKLMFNNSLLEKYGLKPVYSDFLNNYLRLKISLDRKSRAEFVDMNKSNNDNDIINKVSNLSNIGSAKK